MKLVTRKLLAFSLLSVTSLVALLLMRSEQVGTFFYQTRTLKGSSTTPWGRKGGRRSSTEDLEAMDMVHKPHGEKQMGFGYVLVNQYSDQMTGGSYNILSLQCWSGAVSSGLKVVEPFVHVGSSFGVSLSTAGLLERKVKKKEEDDNKVRLQDVLNLDSWEKQLKGEVYAPFESWRVFLKFAPRNLIVVANECEHAMNSCNDHFYGTVSLFAKRHSFVIVRSVHLKNELHSFDEFRDLIYGDHNPRQSVVLFNHWGGILTNLDEYRIGISDVNPKCTRNSFQIRTFLFESSLKIVEDTRIYLDRYMPKGNVSNYISVMLRTEKFMLGHLRIKLSKEEKLSLFTSCVKGIVNLVHTMQDLYKTSGVFLAVDCRKQGSRVFRDNSGPSFMNTDFVNTVVQMLFDDLKKYGNGLSLEEWDASFDYVSSFQTPGYVALLQKNLAAGGACLLTAGGGSFQESAQKLYKSMHNDITQCYMVVPECS